MALRVKISARAANQVRKAAEWWVVNRPAAPGAIGVDFGESVALLAEQPGIGAKYVGSRTPSDVPYRIEWAFKHQSGSHRTLSQLG